MRVSATRNHSLFELAELKKSNNVEAFCRPLMCSKHPDTALNKYCTKTTCRKPVCVNCVIDSCREANDHKIENIDSVANAKRQLMKDQISNTEDISKQIQSIINEIKDEQNEILSMEKSVEDEIDKTFDSLEHILWNRRVDLKKTLKSNVLSKQSHLKAQEDNLRKMKLDIEESNKFANQAVSCPSSPAVLQVYPTIQTKLNTLGTQYFDKKPHEMATFGFNTKGLNSEFQTKLVGITNIWSVSAFPPNCKADVGNILEQNKSANVYVKLRDFQKLAPFKESGLNETNMDIVVKDPTGNETKCWRAMKKGSTDELEVTVKPTMRGRHALLIRILDRLILRMDFESTPVLGQSFANVDQNREIPVFHVPIQKPDLLFDIRRAHRDVSVSLDGKIFNNSATYRQWYPLYSVLGKYKGTLCTTGLKYPGRYYYAIKVDIKVKKPLDKSNLVFELGIARMSAIGNNLVVEGSKFAWSMIGAHHVDCDAICLHIAHNNHLLYHEVLTKNETGSTMERVFGFLLDTEFGQWKVFDHKIEKEICVVESVDCSEFLYPVVAGYNPNSVEVTATFMDV